MVSFGIPSLETKSPFQFSPLSTLPTFGQSSSNREMAKETSPYVYVNPPKDTVYRCKKCNSVPITAFQLSPLELQPICQDCKSLYGSPYIVVQHLLDQLVVYCSNEENGCTEQVSRCELENHLKICDYNMQPCEFMWLGCTTELFTKSSKDHDCIPDLKQVIRKISARLENLEVNLEKTNNELNQSRKEQKISKEEANMKITSLSLRLAQKEFELSNLSRKFSQEMDNIKEKQVSLIDTSHIYHHSTFRNAEGMISLRQDNVTVRVREKVEAEDLFGKLSQNMMIANLTIESFCAILEDIPRMKNNFVVAKLQIKFNEYGLQYQRSTEKLTIDSSKEFGDTIESMELEELQLESLKFGTGSGKILAEILRKCDVKVQLIKCTYEAESDKLVLAQLPNVVIV